jgi:hypothetical protein
LKTISPEAGNINILKLFSVILVSVEMARKIHAGMAI